MKICSYVVCTVHLYLYIVQYYTYATNHKTEILMIDHIAYLLWKNELTIRSPSGLIASSGMRRKSSRLRLHTTYTYEMIKWIVRRRSIGSEWHEVIDHRTKSSKLNFRRRGTPEVPVVTLVERYEATIQPDDLVTCNCIWQAHDSS